MGREKRKRRDLDCHGIVGKKGVLRQILGRKRWQIGYFWKKGLHGPSLNNLRNSIPKKNRGGRRLKKEKIHITDGSPKKRKNLLAR